MKCLVTDAKRRDCFWFHLRLSSLPVDNHWKYKRELKTETRIVWQRMKTRVRFLRYSSEWYESEWLWNQRAWKAWDESADGENGNSGAPSSVEPAGGVKELKTPDERLMKEVQIRWPTSVAARKPEKVLISPQTLCDIKLWKKISLHVFDQFQIQSRPTRFGCRQIHGTQSMQRGACGLMWVTKIAVRHFRVIGSAILSKCKWGA